MLKEERRAVVNAVELKKILLNYMCVGIYVKCDGRSIYLHI